MPDLNIIADFFLLFGKEIFLVPLIVSGFLALDRKIFGHATIILMFTMIYNVILKNTFQVPLASHLNIVGYAFPSGHMHSAIAFYGWLMLNSKNLVIKIILGLILAGVAFGLIYKEFHNFYDIAGAIIFGSITLLIYFKLDNTKMLHNKPFLLGYLMIILAAAIMWYLDTIPNHVWMAFMVLCGFTLSWTLFANSISSNPSFLAAIIGFIFIAGIYYLSTQLKVMVNVNYDFQWVIVGILIPLTARVAGNFNFKK